MKTCPETTRDYSKDLVGTIFMMHSEIKGSGMFYFCQEAMQSDIAFVRNRLSCWEKTTDQV